MPSGSDHVDTSAVKQYKENIMSSLKYHARIVGLLYLIVGVFGGLAVG
jgi:amino acid permease